LKSNSVKIYLLIFAINIVNADSVKFGLGSCLDQDYPQPIWNSIEKEELDYFIFLGDNVYGDSPFGNLRKMKRAYDKQKKVLPNFLNDLEVYAIWDDHDYGLNDGGSDYKNKIDAEKLFLDFWEISQNDPRHKREGIYFSTEKIFFDKKFKLIFLDTRFFRSKLSGEKGGYIGNTNDNATILGKNQWQWLEHELNTEFDFLIIFSSIQIIPMDHPYEKWSNFPNERSKLLGVLNKFRDKTILFSGDRHRSGIYKKDGIFEITASSLNKPGSLFNETDKFLIGETYPEANYALFEISGNQIDVQIKNLNGEILNSIGLNY
tara:strand:- start:932 stop:1888 length:957 start_codon:yes stop_codon:yes gene_type:complete